MEEQDYAHFSSIPWCARLLNDPSFTITPTPSRQPKNPSTEDSLIATTLNTPSTISAYLTLYKKPSPPSSHISEIRTLVTLGSAMNGGEDVLHGGIVATLMDDVIGVLLTLNKKNEGVSVTGSSTVTAGLNVKFLRPVRTPGTVVVVARCRNVKGRKFFMEAEIRDGEENAMATVESVWIGPREERL